VKKEKEHEEQREADIRHTVRIEEMERMRIREELGTEKPLPAENINNSTDT
jgi:hypothetical protein